jgi:hypothetical protein
VPLQACREGVPIVLVKANSKEQRKKKEGGGGEKEKDKPLFMEGGWANCYSCMYGPCVGSENSHHGDVAS